MKRVRRRHLLNKIRIPLNLANQRGEWVPRDNLFDYLANDKSPDSARIDCDILKCSRQSGSFEMPSRWYEAGGVLPVGGLFYLKRIYIDGSLNSRVFGRERRMILMKNPPTIAPNIYTHPFAMCWGNIQWQHPQTTSNYKWIMGTLLRDLFLASLIQWKSLSANKLLQKSKWKLGKCDCRCLWSVLVSFFWISLRPHVNHQGVIYGHGGWSGLNRMLLLRCFSQEKLSFFFRTSCLGCIFVCCRLIENEFIPTEGLLFLIQNNSFWVPSVPSGLHRFLCFFEVVSIFFCNNTIEIFSQSLEVQYLIESENSWPGGIHQEGRLLNLATE